MTDEQQPENPIDVEKTVEVVSPPTLSAQPERLKKKVPVMLIIIASIVVIGAVVAWFFRGAIIDTLAGKLTVDESATDTSDASQQTAITDPELKKFITPTTGESWYPTPKSITPLGWFKGELASSYTAVDGLSVQEQLNQNTPTYAEVGTRAGGTIILVRDPYSGGIAEAYYLLEKRADGTIAMIVKPQSTGDYDADQLKWANEAVSNKVTVFDESTHYDSLSLPANIDIGNKEAVTRPQYATLQSWGLSAQTETTTKVIKQLGSSQLVRVETVYSDTNLTNIGYYVSLPIGTKIAVEYNPNAASLERYNFSNGANLQYKDATGKMTYDTIMAIARGCSGASAAVTRSDTLKVNQLTKIGTTDAGRAVYEITDKNASLYVKAYKEYQDTYAPGAVSFDEYVKQHGLMVIQNGAGELLVYVRGQYAMGGGCAKPVIYLYPTTVTAVSVRVSAAVTQSDPFYPLNGWVNVLAQPNGALSYGGKRYTSLFWEGTGSGSYPGITSGTVVKHADAAATIRAQLAKQGLNSQEISDFMTFWSDKIPQTPYVRLTWLTTEQMNNLAPLTITPRPSTLIRVFLDMGGLDKPISLPTQQLSSVKRTGFTVVEWGGLTSEIRH